MIWGHRTDIDEYITVDDALILQRAGELRAEGLGLRGDGGEGGGGGGDIVRADGVRLEPVTQKHFDVPSVKVFKLHTTHIFHTNYALPRFDPISRLTCCSLVDQVNLTELDTEIAASSRFFAYR